VVQLRPVEPADLERIYEHQADPVAVALADVPSRDRREFDEHWTRLLADPDVVTRTITDDGQMVGHAMSFMIEGERMVGYWIGREHWGRGIASDALVRFLEVETRRPLHARVAPDNAASIRILTKSGFVLHRRLPNGYEFVLD
jgi:RimJ/RimL family protein N-acetyltransferase